MGGITFKKQINIEIADESVYNHLKSQSHMGNYLTQLIRSDMLSSVTLADRLELFESAVKPHHIKLDGVEWQIVEMGRSFDPESDMLTKFTFQLEEKLAEQEMKRLDDGNGHFFAVKSLDGRHYFGTAKVVQQKGTHPYRLEIMTIKRK